jgi:hypothetical protein
MGRNCAIFLKTVRQPDAIAGFLSQSGTQNWASGFSGTADQCGGTPEINNISERFVTGV